MIANRIIIAALVLILAPAAMASGNEPVPTPMIKEFNIFDETAAGGFVLGAVLPLEGQPDVRVGMALVCEEARIEVRGFFGFYPVDLPVQMAVKSPDGKVWRHDRRELTVPQSGFHSPIITERSQVVAFLQVTLQRGSLISNGFNSFWNDLPEDINRKTSARLLACGQDQ